MKYRIFSILDILSRLVEPASRLMTTRDRHQLPVTQNRMDGYSVRTHLNQLQKQSSFFLFFIFYFFTAVQLPS